MTQVQNMAQRIVELEREIVRAEAVIEAARTVVDDFRISEPFVTELRAALTAYDEPPKATIDDLFIPTEQA